MTALGEGMLSTCVSQALQRVWCSMYDFLSNMGGNLSLWVVSLHLGIDIVPGGGATHDL